MEERGRVPQEPQQVHSGEVVSMLFPIFQIDDLPILDESADASAEPVPA